MPPRNVIPKPVRIRTRRCGWPARGPNPRRSPASSDGSPLVSSCSPADMARPVDMYHEASNAVCRALRSTPRSSPSAVRAAHVGSNRGAGRAALGAVSGAASSARDHVLSTLGMHAPCNTDFGRSTRSFAPIPSWVSGPAAPVRHPDMLAGGVQAITRPAGVDECMFS